MLRRRQEEMGRTIRQARLKLIYFVALWCSLQVTGSCGVGVMSSLPFFAGEATEHVSTAAARDRSWGVWNAFKQRLPNWRWRGRSAANGSTALSINDPLEKSSLSLRSRSDKEAGNIAIHAPPPRPAGRDEDERELIRDGPDENDPPSPVDRTAGCEMQPNSTSVNDVPPSPSASSASPGVANEIREQHVRRPLPAHTCTKKPAPAQNGTSHGASGLDVVPIPGADPEKAETSEDGSCTGSGDAGCPGTASGRGGATETLERDCCSSDFVPQDAATSRRYCAGGGRCRPQLNTACRCTRRTTAFSARNGAHLAAPRVTEVSLPSQNHASSRTVRTDTTVNPHGGAPVLPEIPGTTSTATRTTTGVRREKSLRSPETTTRSPPESEAEVPLDLVHLPIPSASAKPSGRVGPGPPPPASLAGTEDVDANASTRSGSSTTERSSPLVVPPKPAPSKRARPPGAVARTQGSKKTRRSWGHLLAGLVRGGAGKAMTAANKGLAYAASAPKGVAYAIWRNALAVCLRRDWTSLLRHAPSVFAKAVDVGGAFPAVWALSRLALKVARCVLESIPPLCPVCYWGSRKPITAGESVWLQDPQTENWVTGMIVERVIDAAKMDEDGQHGGTSPDLRAGNRAWRVLRNPFANHGTPANICGKTSEPMKHPPRKRRLVKLRGRPEPVDYRRILQGNEEPRLFCDDVMHTNAPLTPLENDPSREFRRRATGEARPEPVFGLVSQILIDLAYVVGQYRKNFDDGVRALLRGKNPRPHLPANVELTFPPLPQEQQASQSQSVSEGEQQQDHENHVVSVKRRRTVFAGIVHDVPSQHEIQALLDEYLRRPEPGKNKPQNGGKDLPSSPTPTRSDRTFCTGLFGDHTVCGRRDRFVEFFPQEKTKDIDMEGMLKVFGVDYDLSYEHYTWQQDQRTCEKTRTAGRAFPVEDTTARGGNLQLQPSGKTGYGLGGTYDHATMDFRAAHVPAWVLGQLKHLILRCPGVRQGIAGGKMSYAQLRRMYLGGKIAVKKGGEHAAGAASAVVGNCVQGVSAVIRLFQKLVIAFAGPLGKKARRSRREKQRGAPVVDAADEEVEVGRGAGNDSSPPGETENPPAPAISQFSPVSTGTSSTDRATPTPAAAPSSTEASSRNKSPPDHFQNYDLVLDRIAIEKVHSTGGVAELGLSQTDRGDYVVDGHLKDGKASIKNLILHDVWHKVPGYLCLGHVDAEKIQIPHFHFALGFRAMRTIEEEGWRRKMLSSGRRKANSISSASQHEPKPASTDTATDAQAPPQPGSGSILKFFASLAKHRRMKMENVREKHLVFPSHALKAGFNTLGSYRVLLAGKDPPLGANQGGRPRVRSGSHGRAGAARKEEAKDKERRRVSYQQKYAVDAQPLLNPSWAWTMIGKPLFTSLPENVPPAEIADGGQAVDIQNVRCEYFKINPSHTMVGGLTRLAQTLGGTWSKELEEAVKPYVGRLVHDIVLDSNAKAMMVPILDLIMQPLLVNLGSVMAHMVTERGKVSPGFKQLRARARLDQCRARRRHHLSPGGSSSWSSASEAEQVIESDTLLMDNDGNVLQSPEDLLGLGPGGSTSAPGRGREDSEPDERDFCAEIEMFTPYYGLLNMSPLLTGSLDGALVDDPDVEDDLETEMEAGKLLRVWHPGSPGINMAAGDQEQSGAGAALPAEPFRVLTESLQQMAAKYGVRLVAKDGVSQVEAARIEKIEWTPTGGTVAGVVEIDDAVLEFPDCAGAWPGAVGGSGGFARNDDDADDVDGGGAVPASSCSRYLKRVWGIRMKSTASASMRYLTSRYFPFDLVQNPKLRDDLETNNFRGGVEDDRFPLVRARRDDVENEDQRSDSGAEDHHPTREDDDFELDNGSESSGGAESSDVEEVVDDVEELFASRDDLDQKMTGEGLAGGEGSNGSSGRSWQTQTPTDKKFVDFEQQMDGAEATLEVGSNAWGIENVFVSVAGAREGHISSVTGSSVFLFEKRTGYYEGWNFAPLTNFELSAFLYLHVMLFSFVIYLVFKVIAERCNHTGLSCRTQLRRKCCGSRGCCRRYFICCGTGTNRDHRRRRTTRGHRSTRTGRRTFEFGRVRGRSTKRSAYLPRSTKSRRLSIADEELISTSRKRGSPIEGRGDGTSRRSPQLDHARIGRGGRETELIARAGAAGGGSGALRAASPMMGMQEHEQSGSYSPSQRRPRRELLTKIPSVQGRAQKHPRNKVEIIEFVHFFGASRLLGAYTKTTR